jgi:hypothetical protein
MGTQQTQTLTAKIASRWLNIVLIVLMVMMMANHFVVGGVPGAVEVMTWVSKITPWMGPLAVIVLTRYQYRVWREKRAGWKVAPLYIISFAASFLYVMLIGQDALYTDWYVISVGNSWTITKTMQAISFAQAYRMVTARNWMMTEILIFTIIGLLAGVPILFAISPQATEFVEWMVGQNIASVEVVYTSYNNALIGVMAMFILATHVMTGAEDMKPT